MNTPIIDTKCSSCRRPYRGRGEWDLVILASKLIGTICPRCAETETSGHNPSVRAVAAAVLHDTAVDGRIRGRSLSPHVHMLSRPGNGLTLQLDQTQISSPKEAAELGQTLLLLGQLLIPAIYSTPELKEGPGLNAA